MANHAHENQSAGATGERELFWQAFCYVAGELSADAAEQFEARLEVDQRAREAVAQAVELAAAARSAEGLVVPDRPAALPIDSEPLSAMRRWGAPAGGWALAVAAGIALVIAGYSRLARQAPEVQGEAENAGRQLADFGPAHQGLADTWAASNWGGALIDRENSLVVDADLLSDEGPASDGELLVSDWLMEAVSSAQNLPAAEINHREG